MIMYRVGYLLMATLFGAATYHECQYLCKDPSCVELKNSKASEFRCAFRRQKRSMRFRRKGKKSPFS